MVVLKTERLILREFLESDLVAVHEYAQDKVTVRFLDWGPNTLRETTFFLKESIGFQTEEPRTTFDLAVVISETNRLIGGCSVAVLESDRVAAGLGYLLNRDFWGKGYATEAASVMVNFAFDVLGMQRVVAACDSENLDSEKVMKKLGMQRDALLRRDKFMKGKYRDTLIYSIARSEWLNEHLDLNGVLKEG